jgi:Domain of unknown function (DUF6362)
MDTLEVFEQIERAVVTIRKLPRVAVKERFCNWPEIIRSFNEAYGYNDPDPPRVRPTARQISEMDIVINWFAWLSQYGEHGEYAKILWARAEKRTWRHIAKVAGLNKDSCRERFRVGLFALHHAIETGAVN